MVVAIHTFSEVCSDITLRSASGCPTGTESPEVHQVPAGLGIGLTLAKALVSVVLTSAEGVGDVIRHATEEPAHCPDLAPVV
jgi:hypothetical protein